MSKKQKFVDFVNENLFNNLDKSAVDEDIITYWEVFSGGNDANKPQFTDNGKMVLNFMIENQHLTMLKAKDIADKIFVSSRMVSGAMRKLVSDGYVEKLEGSPVVYSLTEKGKNVKFED